MEIGDKVMVIAPDDEYRGRRGIIMSEARWASSCFALNLFNVKMTDGAIRLYEEAELTDKKGDQ